MQNQESFVMLLSLCKLASVKIIESLFYCSTRLFLAWPNLIRWRRSRTIVTRTVKIQRGRRCHTRKFQSSQLMDHCLLISSSNPSLIFFKPWQISASCSPFPFCFISDNHCSTITWTVAAPSLRRLCECVCMWPQGSLIPLAKEWVMREHHAYAWKTLGIILQDRLHWCCGTNAVIIISLLILLMNTKRSP